MQLNKKQKKRLKRIVISIVLYAIAIIINLTFKNSEFLKPYSPFGLAEAEYSPVCIAILIAAYITAGYDVLKKAAKGIGSGRIFDENFLMSLATLGAIVIEQYPEAVAVMIFYQVGELFQSVAVDTSRRSIAEAMDIRPDYANLLTGGKLNKVAPEDVNIGDCIIVKPGERVPLDGINIEGESFLDTAALTGESVPRKVKPLDDVMSGCINLNGSITVRVKKKYGESTVSRILNLVENASSRKSKSENFISHFAAVYTPVVVILAVIIALVPPLVNSEWTFRYWIYTALTFLVVSCPCALVISIPLSFFGGIGGASSRGILVKGSNYLEALAKTRTVVFDKTGTLTKGVFEVQSINPTGMSKEELLYCAAYAEYDSTHPIAVSIRKEFGKEIDRSKLSNYTEIAGQGIRVKLDGRTVLAGNKKLLSEQGIKKTDLSDETGTTVYVAVDGAYAGSISIADEIKPDASDSIRELKRNGVKRTVMLTGDNEKAADFVAKKIGIDEFHAELFPEDKVAQVEKYLASCHYGEKLVFVGDGINDAPVLARADIGIAMGGLGSDAAIEAADVVILTDEPSKIATAIKIAARTLKIARQNTVFAITIKVLVLLLSILHIANMWWAVFADVGVAVIAILNSMRMLNTKGIN